MTEKSYEAPSITVLGNVHDLTQTAAKFVSPVSDGFTFNGDLINNS